VRASNLVAGCVAQREKRRLPLAASRSLPTILFLLGVGALAGRAIADPPPPVVFPDSSSASPSATPPMATPYSGAIVVPDQAMPSPEDMAKRTEAMEKAKQAVSDAAKGKPEDKEKDKGKKEPDESKTVTRPTEPPKKPDPKELEVGPDANGMVQFNFRGQPWPAVLEWLARISKMSLDWLELPGGYVNLATQRRYTVPQTRDLVNRLLLDRGYTLLYEGEVMSVAKISKLNPSLVPRVAPEDLAKHQPYEFVRVSFPLERLVAETAVKELEPYCRPNGKLTAMSETNRLEAMDAVVNLRDVYALIAREENADSRARPPWVKRLRYRKASEVVACLQRLLGQPSTAPAGGSSPGDQMRQMQQQMQQQMQAAMQAAQQQGKKGGPAAPPKAADVYLVADDRNNAVIAYAPVDKLAIIKKAVAEIDVAPQADPSLQAMLSRTRPYHLSTMEPEPLIRALEESGTLSPDTRLTSYPGGKTIIASASLADHMRIAELIKQLDGSGRRGEVIQLRRLPADGVAGTIRQLFFGGGEEGGKKRTFSLYDSWDPYSRGSSEKKSGDRFQVDADVETNRLLLWANKFEMQQVKDFLTKLGENPDGDVNHDTIRVLGAFSPEETRALMETIRRDWTGDNPLRIEEPPPAEPPTQPSQPSEDKQTRRPDRPGSAGPRVTFAELRVEPPAEASSETSAKDRDLPPIMIRRNAQGRLVIVSKDTEALDRMEGLIAKLAPPRSRYRFFHLKNTWSVDVVENLKTYFKDESGPSLEDVYRAGWYGNRISTNDDSGGATRLSRRRPLTFLDVDDNTVLVKDADPDQLRVIEELIAEFDRPEPMDSENLRQEGLFQIRYSKASVIAATLKEVYRDLLSPNDKAFESKKGQDRNNFFDYVFGHSGLGSDDKIERAPKFKGLLSVGVDDLSNTLWVSAPVYVYRRVELKIRELDEAARPAVSRVGVIRLGQGVTADGLEEALARIIAEPSAGSTGRSSRGSSHSDSRHEDHPSSRKR